ncbi:hypothetical protein M3Y99_00942100 [Aphelenchoides fujianensis]|nr:hypothetical protein M3Y99_00942100 [Aphelenchoides fujianensis]
MKATLFFVLFAVCFLAVDARARARHHRQRHHAPKRSLVGAKRTINAEALERQHQFYSCMERDGVEELQKYLAVRYDPKKTKAQIANYHHNAHLKLTGSKNQETVTCAYTYERDEQVRQNAIKELRKSDRDQLDGAAKSAFDRINKILDDQSMTMEAERKAVGAIWTKLSRADKSQLKKSDTLNKIGDLVSISRPFDYGISYYGPPYPLLETTAKELNLELLYFCLRREGAAQLKKYWGIERKRGLKKIDVWKREQRFFKQFANGPNAKCFENYKQFEEERRAQKDGNRIEFESQMTSKTRAVYQKICKIRDNLQLTIDEEIQQIKKIEHGLDAKTRAELFRVSPELRRYFNAGTYSTL